MQFIMLSAIQMPFLIHSNGCWFAVMEDKGLPLVSVIYIYIISPSPRQLCIHQHSYFFQTKLSSSFSFTLRFLFSNLSSFLTRSMHNKLLEFEPKHSGYGPSFYRAIWMLCRQVLHLSALRAASQMHARCPWTKSLSSNTAPCFSFSPFSDALEHIWLL